MTSNNSKKAIKIGVSACLLGEPVRYDGENKRDDVVAEVLARRFELVAVCPEVAIGMGVPRKPIHLVRHGGQLDAVRVEDGGGSVGRQLVDYGDEIARCYGDLCGYVFKARSPSCSLQGIAVDEGKNGELHPGLFAGRLLQLLPGLPAVEEEALATEAGRAEFIRRVEAYCRARV